MYVGYVSVVYLCTNSELCYLNTVNLTVLIAYMQTNGINILVPISVTIADKTSAE